MGALLAPVVCGPAIDPRRGRSLGHADIDGAQELGSCHYQIGSEVSGGVLGAAYNHAEGPRKSDQDMCAET